MAANVNVPAIFPVFTVRNAMIACGVNDEALFDGDTPAQRIAADLFGDDFSTCMDKSYEELNQEFKTYSDLTQNQGQIRLMPGTKRLIKAFIQWARDERRLGRDPSTIAFPVENAPILLRRYKTHDQFVTKSKTLSDAAKPEKFKTTTKWADWAPTFLNYLRTMPGRDGVPLKYVCRINEAPDPNPNGDFLDDYVAMAALDGEAFTIDAADVHTFIVNFISGNETAEAKIQAYEAQNNGRLDYIALKEHYEGVGLHALDIMKAENTLNTLFYSGEKKPHMWWEEFEQQITSAFTIFNRREGRVVHSDEMKLRILLNKIQADFLVHVKASIGIELTRQPITLSYEQALATFRNEVNRKFPPNMASATRTRRSINEMGTQGRGRGGRFGRGRAPSHGGRGRGGRGRGGRGRTPRSRTDSSLITLTDGQEIEYHPSFHFPPAIFNKMKPQDRERMTKERREYNQGRGQTSHDRDQSRQIQELQAQLSVAQSVAHSAHSAQFGQAPPPPAPTDISIGQASQISQMTRGTMFGGRNEQDALRRGGRGRW
jgi:hypothetical protein